MRVLAVTVENFRSVVRTDLRLDQRITVLLGGNEQGKTSLLRALQFLDRDAVLAEDDLTHRGDIRGGSASGGPDLSRIRIANVTVEVPADLRSLIAGAKVCTLARFADGHYELADPPMPSITELEEERASVRGAIDAKTSDLRTKLAALTEALTQVATAAPDAAPSIASVSAALSSVGKLDLAADGAASEFERLVEGLAATADQPEALASATGAFRAYSSTLLDALDSDRARLAELAATHPLDRLVAELPRFVYFRTQDLLEDQVSLPELSSGLTGHPILRSLLALCDLDPASLSTQSPTARAQATSRGSTRISGEVNNFWRQANVDMRVQVDGQQLIVLIDEPGAAPLRPSQRSDGFQWFLSFYIALTAGTKGALRDAVLLLDDPGVYLHASGQRDLLNTLERLSDSNQIVFATHSPFLVDRQHLERIRIVDKSPEDGTRVVEKFWTSARDALAPIRASIGMSLGQALFSSKHTIAVEGLSDLYIIQALSILSGQNGGETIDFSSCAVLPVGGGQARQLVPLLAKDSDDYFVIFDSDAEGQKTIKYLSDEYGLPEEKLATLREAGIAPWGGKDFEIEDIIAPEDYLSAVNHRYHDQLRAGLTDADLDASGVSSQRIVRRLDKLFQDRRLGAFDKIEVALAFRQMLDAGDSVSESTTERAMLLIAYLNGRFRSAP
jgi:AAA domain, putative AbiEii toxin, Type IV TA system/AAA ATPase domain